MASSSVDARLEAWYSVSRALMDRENEKVSENDSDILRKRYLISSATMLDKSVTIRRMQGLNWEWARIGAIEYGKSALPVV